MGKASKAKRLLKDIIEGGDAEAAKAAEAAKVRAAQDAADREAKVLADPLIAGLMPSKLVDDDEQVKKDDEGDAAEEIDELLKDGRKRSKKQHAADTPSKKAKSTETASTK